MADYIVTYEKVQTLGNLPKVEQTVIEVFFPEAKREVVDRIGQAEYDRIFALAADDDDRLNVETAEARFVLYYMIPELNISTSGDGITKSRGTGDGRKENLSENDINTIIERHKEKAEKILEGYAVTVDADEDENPDLLITPGLSFAALDYSGDIEELDD